MLGIIHPFDLFSFTITPENTLLLTANCTLVINLLHVVSNKHTIKVFLLKDLEARNFSKVIKEYNFYNLLINIVTFKKHTSAVLNQDHY